MLSCRGREWRTASVVNPSGDRHCCVLCKYNMQGLDKIMQTLQESLNVKSRWLTSTYIHSAVSRSLYSKLSVEALCSASFLSLELLFKAPADWNNSPAGVRFMAHLSSYLEIDCFSRFYLVIHSHVIIYLVLAILTI